MPTPQRSLFALSAVTDLATQQCLRLLIDKVHALEGRPATAPIWEASPDANAERLRNLGAPVADADAVTKAWAETTLPETMRTALSAHGITPLSVQGLHGRLADAQSARITVISDDVALPDPTTYPTHLIIWHRGKLYFLDASTTPPTWQLVTTAGSLLTDTHANKILTYGWTPDLPLGTLFWETDRTALYYVVSAGGATHWQFVVGRPVEDTISPDNKPADLNPYDVGFLFYATDFARTFRWNGTAWEDAPGAPARFQLAFFTATPSPSAGWGLCDGGSVTRSTTTGGTTSLTTPDLITDNLFVRGAGSAGGTGGTATHLHAVDPPNTTSGGPSATVEVQSGTGTTVATDTHTHDTNIASFSSATGSHLPPFIEMLPFVRL